MTSPSTGIWPLERPRSRPRPQPRARLRAGIMAAVALGALACVSALLVLVPADPPSIAGRSLAARIEDAVVALGLGLDQVELKGHKLASDSQILDAVGLAEARTFLTFDVAMARTRVERLPWVESALIERLYPNRIAVTIIERRPFAAWQQGDKDILVDATGRELVQIARGSAPALPRIAGAGAPQDAARLLAQIAIYPDLARQIAISERVSGRSGLLK